MSVVSGANPIKSGLVFHYDMGNTKKSWMGAPTTNLLGSYQDLSANWTFVGAGSVVLNSIVLPNIPSVSSYTVTDSDSAGYSYITKSIAVPNDSATYIISIYIKKTFGNALVKCGFNIFLNGGTSVASYVRMNPNDGNATGGTCTSVDDVWWRWSIPITNNSTGNTTLLIQFFPSVTLISTGTDSVANTGSIIVGGIQAETGSFATPFTSGTRTNTQNIVDLTGNNTITANSLTYNSDGSFKFLQSGGGYISTGTNFNTVMTGTQSFTIESWINPEETQVAYSDICGYHSPDGIVVQQNNLTMNQYYFCFSVGGNVFKYSYFSLTANTHNHLVIAKNSTYTSVWVNGVRVAYNNYTEAIVTNANTFMVGNGIGGSTSRCFNGRIPVFRVYNRELSYSEIIQNLYASRSRFGV